MFEYSKPKARGLRYLAAVSLVVLCLGLVPAVNAGIVPSPFRDVGQLGAVSNGLASINDRLIHVLSTQLDPSEIGRVNQLGAMEGEIDVLERISAVLFAPQPEPPDMPRVIVALTEVRDNAQAIVDTADAALKNPREGEDTAELIGVREAAQDIVDRANEILGQ